MARRTAELEDVDVTSETEEAPDTNAEAPAAKKAAAKKEPKRGDLPEGFVTPIGLAKVLTERELHTDKNGGHEVRPQMVYSYIKNAPKDDPFPSQTVKDSIGADRNVVELEAGVAWWERKNERVSAKRANAQEKKDKKAANAAKKAAAAEAEGSSDTGDATEAE